MADLVAQLLPVLVLVPVPIAAAVALAYARGRHRGLSEGLQLARAALSCGSTSDDPPPAAARGRGVIPFPTARRCV